MKNNIAGTNAGNNQNEAKEPQASGNGRLRRMLAGLMLLIIAVLFCVLIYLAATGAPPEALLSVLFCLIVIPCLLYAFKLYIDFTTKKR
ncbi:MAG: hypothetical protein Q4C63_08820 [Eubacteriales bacterium]|nr:hypothetical protein [Eubacteriales bacterium]